MRSWQGVVPSSNDKLNYQWNGCCGGQIYPMGYVVVNSVSDIQSAVMCSQKTNIRIVAKGGGHSYGKYSFGDGQTVIIDLQNLNGVYISNDQVTVEPGVIMGPLAYKLYKSSKVGIPFGQCPPVGISYSMGGGYGDFSRLFGLAVDSIQSLQVVTAKGELKTTSDKENADLFWALRGAGAGSFGIVTNYTFKMVNAPEAVVLSKGYYDLPQFPGVMHAFEKYLLSKPPNNLNLLLFIKKDLVIRIIHIIPSGSGGSSAAAVAKENLENIWKDSFPKTKKLEFEALSYLQFMINSGNEETGNKLNLTIPEQLQNVTRYDFDVGGDFRTRTFFVPSSTGGKHNFTGLYQHIVQRPTNIRIKMRALRGKINDVESSATAYVHRSQNLYQVDLSVAGPATQSSLPWIEQYFGLERSAKRLSEYYQNHIDVELNVKEALRGYYGANLARLIQVKAKYDPGNSFNFPQSIPNKP